MEAHPAFWNVGVMENGLVSPSVEGTPQGEPLSPLLSNLALDELDRELERRGHRLFVTRTTVRHERKGPKGPDVCNCWTDEGRPLGTGLQEQVPNRLRWLWSKAMVVSTGGKGPGRTGSGD